MPLLTLLLLSLAVAMDAVAVSASVGAGARAARTSVALRLAITFGLFQSGMATLGWLAGEEVISRIAAWDHWIAFTLLAVIGGKMIYEGFEEKGEPDTTTLTLANLLILGIATSIDSLAVGVTLPLLEIPLPFAVGSLGIVTFALSLPSALAGGRLSERFGSKIEILGGLVLIGIGIKILVEHLTES